MERDTGRTRWSLDGFEGLQKSAAWDSVAEQHRCWEQENGEAGNYEVPGTARCCCGVRCVDRTPQRGCSGLVSYGKRTGAPASTAANPLPKTSPCAEPPTHENPTRARPGLSGDTAFTHGRRQTPPEESLPVAGIKWRSGAEVSSPQKRRSCPGG